MSGPLDRRWVDKRLLPIALIAQAALLFTSLNLLACWGDECFTLATVAQSPTAIQRILDADIHPPLYYYLLHLWMHLGIPGTPIGQARAMSVAAALLATVCIDRLWLLRLDPAVRLRFLALWTLSPCLLLYARMARSYSLQLCLASVVLFAGAQLLDSPRSWRWVALYTAAGSALLYTHYLPGIAIPAAFSVLAIWRIVRYRDRALVRALVGTHAVIVLGYLPWVLSMTKAVARWGEHTGVYLATGNSIAERGLSLAYWLFSFSYGEALPTWGLVIGLVMAPWILFTLWKSVRPMETWVQLVLVTAAIAFVGAGRWVTFVFIPARLLFLLPFFLLLLVRSQRGRRQWVVPVLLLISGVGVWSYFAREGFLNKGYAAPFDEMAELVNARGGAQALVILDGYNSDAVPFRMRLRHDVPVMTNDDAAALARIREAAGRAQTIMFWRTTHDISAGASNRRLETELAASFRLKRHLFEPLDPLQREFARLLGWPDQPSHFYQVIEMTRIAPTSLSSVNRGGL